MSGASITMVMACALLSIDLGARFVAHRTLQGVADLAAMQAASDIDRAEAAVAAMLEANGVEAAPSIERGQYVADRGLPAAQRFVPGLEPYTAVRVTLEQPGQIYFNSVFDGVKYPVVVKATSSNATLAAFSIGSRLAAVRGGVINRTLGALIGGNLALGLSDYEAMIGAELKVLDFLDALRTRLGVAAITYDDVLNADAGLGDALAAAASVASRQGDLVAAAVLDTLVFRTSRAETFELRHLFDLGPLGSLEIGDRMPGFSPRFAVMDMIQAAAVLANGRNQFNVDLTASVPGFLSLVATIAIGEPMQHATFMAIGRGDAPVTTMQLRMRLVAEIGGTGLLAGLRLRLPLIIETARAEGRVHAIACPGGDEKTAVIGARTGVQRLQVGEVTVASGTIGPARIVDSPLIKVTGQAAIDVGSDMEQRLTFTEEDVAQGTIKRVHTSSISGSAASSLLEQLVLSVTLAGLPLVSPAAVQAAVSNALGPAAVTLDGVLETMLATLGVRLGEADVLVRGISCTMGILAG